MLHKSGESIWAEIKHSISNILMLMGVLSNYMFDILRNISSILKRYYNKIDNPQKSWAN